MIKFGNRWINPNYIVEMTYQEERKETLLTVTSGSAVMFYTQPGDRTSKIIEEIKNVSQ